MVVHETIGMAYPIISLVDLLKRTEEVLAVVVAFENRLSFVPARGYVIHCAGVFDT
jgi:hypothetical protein